MSAPSFVSRIAQMAVERSAAPAVTLHDSGETWTFGELLEATERWNASLAALGVRPGDAVLLALPSSPTLLSAFLAVASLRAVAVPVAEQLTPLELGSILTDSEPVVAIASPRATLAIAASAATTAPFLRSIVVTPAPAEGVVSSRSDLRIVSPSDLERGRAPLESPLPGDVICCGFTYKGLGYPLGAQHRRSAFDTVIEALAGAFPPDDLPTHISAVPIYRVYGLVAGALGPLAHGCHVVLVGRPHRESLGRIARDHDAGLLCLVPPLLRLFLAQQRRQPIALPERFAFCSGGSPLKVETAREAEESTGRRVYEGYGLTEALLVTSNTPRRSSPGSVGVPLDDATGIEVCDASGRPVPPGRVGQVVVTGPTVMVGYRHRPAETARFLREGRLFTGDLGRVDEEGFLHLRGTRLPLAKVNAQMVDLREIEALACARPGVAKACAQLVDDGPHSRLRLSVEPTTDSIVDPEALRGDLRAALSPHKVPQSIEIISRKRTVAQTSPGADDAQKP